MMEEQVNKEEERNHIQNPINLNVNAIFIELCKEVNVNKINVATKLAIEENRKKEEKTDKELVPEKYSEYLDIFSKEKVALFPESKPWDHKIEMKEGFKPKSFMIYNFTLAEQLELDKFLKENLDTEYFFYFFIFFDHQNLPWHHHSLLFLRKMENSDHAKIIITLTIGQSKTPILYH